MSCKRQRKQDKDKKKEGITENINKIENLTALEFRAFLELSNATVTHF